MRRWWWGSLTALSRYNQSAKYSQWLDVIMYLLTPHYGAKIMCFDIILQNLFIDLDLLIIS